MIRCRFRKTSRRDTGRETTTRPIGRCRSKAGRQAGDQQGAPPISVEQYRRLAGAVHGLQVDRGLKTLMVTSSLPNEGKTLTVTNLALTLSESYKRRVLLDRRRPSQAVDPRPVQDSEYDGAGRGPALRARRRAAPAAVDEPQPAAGGRPDANPMAGLTSDRMRALLEQFNQDFDWVLLDAAPVGFMPDAQLLASVTGAVLFVIAAGSTPYSLVQRAVAELGPECVVGHRAQSRRRAEHPGDGVLRLVLRLRRAGGVRTVGGPGTTSGRGRPFGGTCNVTRRRSSGLRRLLAGRTTCYRAWVTHVPAWPQIRGGLPGRRTHCD